MTLCRHKANHEPDHRAKAEKGHRHLNNSKGAIHVLSPIHILCADADAMSRGVP